MSPTSLQDRYDVLIAGARCAGAATAMLLARAGYRVLVVDPLPRGRDTLSTHALMRGAVVQLHRWGLLEELARRGTPPIRSTTFDYGPESVTIPIKPRDGVDALYAPRRTVLDPLLQEAAETAGARIAHGLSLAELVRDRDGRVRGARVVGAKGVGRTVTADLVIGADGARSRVARLVDAPVQHLASNATASVYGYWRGVGREGNRWTFRAGRAAGGGEADRGGEPGVAMGTIPTNEGATCVFVSTTPGAFHAAHGAGLGAVFTSLVGRVDPELAAHVAREAPLGGLRGFAGARGFLRRPVGDGWALVGDAGYFRDPLTAHGITDALRDAELLARAVAGGTDRHLARYAEARDRAARGVMAVTDRIASLGWSVEEVRVLHESLAREMNGAMGVLDEGPLGGPEAAEPAVTAGVVAATRAAPAA